jgi:hypothetical protein
MKAIIFDGTPQEVTEALKAMGVAAPMSAAVAQVAPVAIKDGEAKRDDGGDDDQDGTQPLPLLVAKRVLNRLPTISKNMKKALVALHKIGDEGLLGSELCELLDFEQSQFRGMMGAFGRRVVNTEGWYDGAGFFHYDWDAENGYRYKLFDTSRKAVEAVLLK